MKRAVLCYADDVVEISADERMKYHIQMKYDGIAQKSNKTATLTLSYKCV